MIKILAAVIAIVICEFSLASPVWAGDTRLISTLPPAFKTEQIHDYFVSVLKLVLDKNSDSFGPYELRLSHAMHSGPALLDLSRQAGELDVLWTGSSDLRERHLHAIAVPLVRGALGFRVALMHRRMASRWSAVKTLEDLRGLTVCQGEYWPDSDILEGNGVQVARYKNFEAMLSAVYKGSCDVFLRGIHEGFTEYEQRKDRYPELYLSHSVIVHYDLPMYFFVAKDDSYLAERLKQGLAEALADGSLVELINQHALTRHLFPWSKWRAATVIPLENNRLSKLPELYRQDFWLKPW